MLNYFIVSNNDRTRIAMIHAFGFNKQNIPVRTYPLKGFPELPYYLFRIFCPAFFAHTNANDVIVFLYCVHEK